MKLNYLDIQQIASAATDAALTQVRESLDRKGQTLHPELEKDLRNAIDRFLIASLTTCFEVTKDGNPESN